MIINGLTFQQRRKKMSIGPMGINLFRKHNPWMVVWWSVALPGFGHIQMGMYTKGFILMSGEIAFNLLAHINEAILYSFTGQFKVLHHVINNSWAILYCCVFVFSIWDSYRVAVAINQYTWLESRQGIRDFKYSAVKEFDLNFLDKRSPWVSVFWSMLFTGFGHLLCHRTIGGFTLLGWAIAIDLKAKLPQLIILSLTGQFNRIPQLGVSYEWLLFFPSIYLFGIYDAYYQTVAYNQLFQEEQAYYLGPAE